jgi:hypothetical protein
LTNFSLTSIVTAFMKSTATIQKWKRNTFRVVGSYGRRVSRNAMTHTSVEQEEII